MPNIHLTTFIGAPAERVLDLARHTSIYKSLFQNRNISYKPSASGNILSANESFTLEQKFLKKSRSVTLFVSEFRKGDFLQFSLRKGDIKEYRHDHYVKPVENGTLLIDKVEFGLPIDFFGQLAGKFFMHQKLEALIEARNSLIKQSAESEKWKMILA